MKAEKTYLYSVAHVHKYGETHHTFRSPIPLFEGEIFDEKEGNELLAAIDVNCKGDFEPDREESLSITLVEVNPLMPIPEAVAKTLLKKTKREFLKAQRIDKTRAP